MAFNENCVTFTNILSFGMFQRCLIGGHLINIGEKTVMEKNIKKYINDDKLYVEAFHIKNFIRKQRENV